MNHLSSIVLGLMIAAAPFPAFAQQSAGNIVIEKPWARATPKGASVGAGYMIIHNKSAVADRLTGGSADFAGDVQVHEMNMKGGVMTMRQLTDGLAIPPNGSVTLAPSGYHIMFQNLKQPLSKGETVKATLTFEHAGSVPIELKVESIGATGPGGKAPAVDQMKGMKMD
jgi:periplasmic copper chaperone A